MRRVLLMEGEAVGMLGNIAKVQVSKFMASVVTVMSWRVLLFTHPRDEQTPGLVVTDKNCVDTGSDSANMRYTISPLFVQRYA